MEIKTLIKINKVLQKFGVTLNSLKFGEVKTADGQYTITYKGDNFMVGEPAFVITDEGELPAPDGKHELEDGRTILIEGGQGVVTEIIEAGAPAEPADPNAPAQPEVPATPQMTSEEVERTITERIKKFETEQNEKFEAEKTSLIAKFEAEKKELTTALEEVTDLYEKEKEKPAVAPVQPIKKKQPFAVQSKPSTFDKWYAQFKKK
jgi:hypothetical protein